MDLASVQGDLDACYDVVAGSLGYQQTFETLNQASGTALGDDGWLVFANVFNPDWSYGYNYGPFPAPNNAGGFCGIDNTGQGGPEQGTQVLVVYSDYNNGDAHGNGKHLEANVFRERTIVAGDVGRTLTFAADAKRGNINDPAGSTTAIAFIKVLKQSDFSYALLAFPTYDTTNLSTSWTRISVSVDITPAMQGELLQVGFASTATNYEPSGNFYDNIVVSTVPTP